MRDKAGAADMLRSRAGKKQRPAKGVFLQGMLPPLLIASVVTAYYLSSIASWSPLDSSPFSFSIPRRPSENIGGAYGAWLSGVCIYYFGWLAWLLPLPLILLLTSFGRAIFSFRARGLYLVKCLIVAGLCFLFFAILGDLFLPYTKMAGVVIPTAGSLGEVCVAFLKRCTGQAGLLILVVGLPLWGLLKVSSGQTDAGRLTEEQMGD